jgi:putative ABC transport system permease protein
VTAAATVNYLPLNHEIDMRPFAVPGAETASDGDLPMAITLYASGDYFRAMGVAVLAGRTFDSRDTTDSAPVAMINDVLAERYFPNASPLGAEIDLEGTTVRIIGVVANSKQGDLAEVEEQVYLPISQTPRRYFRVVARTRGDATAAAGAIREAVWRVDPDLPVTQVRSLEQVVDDFLLPQRMISGVLGGMSLGALLLAAVGIYGVIAFIVSQSTREMSIRIALGATRRTVMRHVLGNGMRMAAVGTAIGLVGAVAVTRLMAGLIALPPEQGSMLRSGGFDPVAFVLVPVLLIVLAALACFFPALRATRVDPIVAMRSE